MKLREKNIRKLLKLGGTSLAVTLPEEIVEELGWKKKQRVMIKRIKGGLAVKDYHTKK